MDANLARKLLTSELSGRIKRNPSYSQRAFAKFLNLSPGELSEILNGKRKLSSKKAIHVAERLGLSGHESDQLLQSTLMSKDAVPFKQNSVSLEIFQVISNPLHFAILNLVDCEGFRWSPKWIARKLGASMIEIKEAFGNLLEVGLIHKKGRSFQVDHDFFVTEGNIPSRAIKDYHHHILEKASRALEEQDIEKRDITGVSFALDPKKIAELKKEISQFQDHLVEKYTYIGQKTAVYHFESLLFALTKEDTDV
jgi:uncharacterized protein (TIGR02147 family)